MGIPHPTIDTRDLALFRPLRKKLKSRFIVELPALFRVFAGRNMGHGYLDSVRNAFRSRNLGLTPHKQLEYAKASLELFRICYQIFEGRIEAGSWPCDLPPISCAIHYL
jgi:RNA exonuclease 4